MTRDDRSRRFDAYVPRRLSAFGQGYSLFVRVLKYTLPLAALIIIGILIARLSGEQAKTIAPLARDEKTVPGQIELVGAKYEGVDEQGRPYAVTADKAVRDMNNKEAVLFENPLADIALADKSWVALKGKAGSFDRTTEVLKLTGGVTVFHDSGYQITLQDITVDLKKKTAETAQAVSAQGPLGAITAQNMTVRDDGNLVVFGGPATMTIYKLKGKG